MCTADPVRDGGDAFHPAVGRGFGSASRALEMASAGLDYLNSAAVADLDGAACGETLIALGEIQAKLTAAHAAFLRRFDAADAHDADGYGSSSSWLAAKGGMSKKGARAAVRQMRRLGDRPLLGAALAAGSPALFAASAADRLHEPYRVGDAPHLAAIRADLPAGALGAALSGSGPTVLVWAERAREADVVRELAARFPDHDVRTLSVTSSGAGPL